MQTTDLNELAAKEAQLSLQLLVDAIDTRRTALQQLIGQEALVGRQ